MVWKYCCFPQWTVWTHPVQAMAPVSMVSATVPQAGPDRTVRHRSLCVQNTALATVHSRVRPAPASVMSTGPVLTALQVLLIPWLCDALYGLIWHWEAYLKTPKLFFLNLILKFSVWSLTFHPTVGNWIITVGNGLCSDMLPTLGAVRYTNNVYVSSLISLRWVTFRSHQHFLWPWCTYCTLILQK